MLNNAFVNNNTALAINKPAQKRSTSQNQSMNFSEPACHSYLGEQLKDSRRRGAVEVIWGKEYRLLLIPLVDIVLFPGETIPLRLQDQNLVSHVKRIIRELESNSLGAENNEDLMIGVVNNPRTGRGRQNLVGWFGTTIEVRSSSCTPLTLVARSYNEHNRTTEEVMLTGKGQYRFQIIRMQHVGSGVNYATVRLFDEHNVSFGRHLHEISSFPSWVYEVNAPSTLARRAFQMVETALFWKAESSSLLSRWGLLCNQLPHSEKENEKEEELHSYSSDAEDAADSRHAKRTRTNHTTTTTSSTNNTSNNTHNQTFSTSSTAATTVNPHHLRLDKYYSARYGAELDPVGFSYFLAANLPVSNEQLQHLLEANTVVERLRLCIEYLENGTGKVLACGVCRLPLASKQEVFSVPGAEGVTGAYVNPHGAVHQTITLRDVLDPRAILLHGRPCAEDSWFPGYAWTIASCARCLNHLGWRFTLVPAPRRSVETSVLRALPAALRSFAGTEVEELWRNLLQQQEDMEVANEEEEEGENGDEEGSYSQDSDSGSDIYSDGDYYDAEEDGLEENEENEEGSEGNEGEEVDEGDEGEEGGEGENRSMSSDSEPPSTHSDMRDGPVRNADAVVADADDINRRSSSSSSSSNSNSSSSNESQHNDSAGNNNHNSDTELEQPNAPPLSGDRADERVASFWGLRRSGLVEA